MPSSGPSVFGPSGPLLLAIETAGSGCSAAILRGGAVLAAECRAMRHGHAEALLPMIDRVARAAGIAPGNLELVAVATGPGGFTGIRAGLAAGQGIALAAGARLVGITSFAAVAAASRLHRRAGGPEDGPPSGDPAAVEGGPALLVALDSRRDDLYLQLFAGDRATQLAEPAAVLPDRLVSYIGGLIGGATLVVAGDRAELAADLLGRERPVGLIPDSAPEALGVAAAALDALNAGRGEDAAAWPFYLRPPDVTLPNLGPNAGPKAKTPGSAAAR